MTSEHVLFKFAAVRTIIESSTSKYYELPKQPTITVRAQSFTKYVRTFELFERGGGKLSASAVTWDLQVANAHAMLATNTFIEKQTEPSIILPKIYNEPHIICVIPSTSLTLPRSKNQLTRDTSSEVLNFSLSPRWQKTKKAKAKAKRPN